MKTNCDICGKKIKENNSRGLFNVFGGVLSQHPVLASFVLCIDCCDVVKHALEGISTKRK